MGLVSVASALAAVSLSRPMNALEFQNLPVLCDEAQTCETLKVAIGAVLAWARRRELRAVARNSIGGAFFNLTDLNDVGLSLAAREKVRVMRGNQWGRRPAGQWPGFEFAHLPVLYTDAEACQTLRVSVSTMLVWARRDELVPVARDAIGRALFNLSDLKIIAARENVRVLREDQPERLPPRRVPGRRAKRAS